MDTTDRTAVYSRYYGLFFAIGWLVFLLLAVVNELTGPHPVALKAATVAAAGVFVAVYLWFWLTLYGSGGQKRAFVAVAVLCALAVANSLVTFDVWGGMFIYCGVAAGFAFDWRRSTFATLAVAALAGAIGLLARGTLLWVGLDVVITVLAGLALVSTNRLIAAYRELRLAREEMARLAVAEERLRFARDLHDLLGHSLSVIVLKSELAGRLAATAPERAAREVRDIERVARDALHEVREAVSGYRQAGLAQELEGTRLALRAAGMSVRIQQAAGALPTPVDSVLAWTLREATTNVIRHSRARRVWIRLDEHEDRARLEVLDDGIGGQADGDGSGLRGLRERVLARDGTVEFGARGEGGFRVVVSVPLNRLVEEAATR